MNISGRGRSWTRCHRWRIDRSRLDAEGARQVAEAIRRAVYDLSIIHPTARFGRITVSIGCAEIVPRVDRSWPQLVEQADRMLYVAKREGRNRVCVPTEQPQDLSGAFRVVPQP